MHRPLGDGWRSVFVLKSLKRRRRVSDCSSLPPWLPGWEGLDWTEVSPASGRDARETHKQMEEIIAAVVIIYTQTVHFSRFDEFLLLKVIFIFSGSTCNPVKDVILDYGLVPLHLQYIFNVMSHMFEAIFAGESTWNTLNHLLCQYEITKHYFFTIQLLLIKFLWYLCLEKTTQIFGLFFFFFEEKS